MPRAEQIITEDPLLPPLEKGVLMILEKHPEYLFRKDKKSDIQEIQAWMMAPDVPDPPVWLTNSETHLIAMIEHTLVSLCDKGFIGVIEVSGHDCYGSHEAIAWAQDSINKVSRSAQPPARLPIR